ncbi:MAG: hypothetical protein ACPG4N_03200 [Gammaproteobacteria bacterium]
MNHSSQSPTGLKQQAFFRALLRATGLAVGVAFLAGCHYDTKPDPQGVANYNEHKEEQALIERLKVNHQDYEAVMRLAELRAASGRERMARFNYAQVMAADTTNNPQLKLMQSQAEVHYAILKATYDGQQAIADTGFQFNLKRAEDVLKGQERQ